MSPPEEASPLKLQTLCLAALYKNMNRFNSLLEDFLKKEHKSELSEFSFHRVMTACLEVQLWLLEGSLNSLQFQVAETENILKVSQTNVNQAEKEMLYALVRRAHLQENLKLLSQEAAKWIERAGRMREQQQTSMKIQVYE